MSQLIHWNKIPEVSIPDNLKAWLVFAGSFMQRLKDHGIMDAKIDVIRQVWEAPDADEQLVLGLEEPQAVFIREVFIVSEKKLWMFARSLFPQTTLTGAEAQYAHLQTRALGSVLFQDKEMVRGDFEFTCLQPGMLLHEKMKPYVNQEPIWTRRSRFMKQQKSLLLIECFAPDIMKL